MLHILNLKRYKILPIGGVESGRICACYLGNKEENFVFGTTDKLRNREKLRKIDIQNANVGSLNAIIQNDNFILFLQIFIEFKLQSTGLQPQTWGFCSPLNCSP